MSDPTLVTQIITTGTASVSVIGADGSGKSKVLTAAEVRTAAETISETAINSALSGKQVTLVSGTNIKTINSTSLLGLGDIAISSGALTTVTITDAAVAMTANRRYQGSIAAFTADRNYTLPAGTAGDVIEVQLTTGDDLYELILLGATGVSINGGSAATEWSRLFLSNEFVRFCCHATNDWRVEIDRRISEIGKIYGVATTEYTIDATTKYTLGGSASDLGLAGTNEIIVRRAGIYQISASNSFQPSGGAYRSTAIGVGDSGAAWASLTNIGQKISRFTTGFQQTEVYVGDVSLIAGQAVSIWYYTDSITGTNQYYTTENARPNLCVRRIR